MKFSTNSYDEIDEYLKQAEEEIAEALLITQEKPRETEITEQIAFRSSPPFSQTNNEQGLSLFGSDRVPKSYDRRGRPSLENFHISQWSQNVLKDFQNLVQEEISFLKPSPQISTMGATNSALHSLEGFGDNYSAFKTGTFPRSNRSHSLMDSSIETTHPDDKDDSCRLLSVKHHRFSRSYSLDGTTEVLGSWALHQFSSSNEPQDIFRSTPKNSGHVKEDTSEWQPIYQSYSECEENINNTTDSRDYDSGDGRSLTTKSEGSALTAEVFDQHPGNEWTWADEEGPCSITERSFDEQFCCLPEPPSIVVEEYEDSEDLIEHQLEADGKNYCLNVGRKSEPTLPLAMSPILGIPGLELRRHTLPNTSELLEVPSKLIFNTASWETLPPAEEMEVMEEKSIQLNSDGEKTLTQNHRSLSRSLNSSLSCLSQLSITEDFSENECDIVGTNGYLDQDIDPDVFLNPCFQNNLENPELSYSEASSQNHLSSIPKPALKSIERSKSDDESAKSLSLETVRLPQGISSEPFIRAPEVLSAYLRVNSQPTNYSKEIILTLSIPKKSQLIYSSIDNKNVMEDKENESDLPKDILDLKNKSKDELGCSTSDPSCKDVARNDNQLKCLEKNEVPKESSLIQKPKTFGDLRHFLEQIENIIANTSSYSANSEGEWNRYDTVSPHSSVPSAKDTSTQTSPSKTSVCSSPAQSFTWISDCTCNTTSSEFCTSSVLLSATEDESMSEEWSDEDEFTSSPSLTATSPNLHDSSLSLESIDQEHELGINTESGIGTLSARVSISPQTNMSSFNFSGSNLSSEDTGLDNSFEKRYRGSLPASERPFGDRSVCYRRKKNRQRRLDMWTQRKNRMKETQPLHENRRIGDFKDHAAFPGVPCMHHTSSESKLPDKPFQSDSVRRTCSEALLCPVPVRRTRLDLPSMEVEQPPRKSIRTDRVRVPSRSVPQERYRRKKSRNSFNQSPFEKSMMDHQGIPLEAQSAAELSEIEATEACKWLRAAGFPQYAQMYEDFQFPLDLASVERDHTFLDNDSLQALFRRLKILNRCARIRLDNSTKSQFDDSEEDEECALSRNWQFQHSSRRWSRINPSQGNVISDEPDPCENHSLTEDPELTSQFKRSGSLRIRDGAKAIFRRIESLKTKKKKKIQDNLVIGSPEVQDEQHMKARMLELGCVEIHEKNTPMNGNSSLRVRKSSTPEDCENRNVSSATGTPLLSSHGVSRRHATSLTYGLTKARENVSPTHYSNEARHSIYDNIPPIICNNNFHSYTDTDMRADEECECSEGTIDSRESPRPSTPCDENRKDPSSERSTLDRWHSFNRKSGSSSMSHQNSTRITSFSVGQMNHLRKRALLRLTALMERYCPANRNTWNWELPKFMKKTKTPDYKDKIYFGVPLQVLNQRIGQPLPPSILQALSYLKEYCLDQVGIFRKPGVKTRIQKLREIHETMGGPIAYHNFCPFDIADMVKTYFRELPEVLLTAKFSAIFITICQYFPESMWIEGLQCTMVMMPDENREALAVLLNFLSNVASNNHLNQMTANNLAVCMSPTLFHLNLGNSSPLRRKGMVPAESKDLHDNKASHQCLALMIKEANQLQCVPAKMLANCRFSYLDNSQPVYLENLGSGGTDCPDSPAEGHWSVYMDACVQSLLRETKEKSKGWVYVNHHDPDVVLGYRKVGDGHPLRLWKVTTEVEAPPTEVITRILRERHLWDDELLQWRVLKKLDSQAEVFQYICSSMSPKPSIDFCLLRYWRTDLDHGTCVIVETSVEHSEAPPLLRCSRGIILASRYLIQPSGAGKSRVTHISRTDLRGRLPEWYNKTYPFIAALHIVKLRNSFQHTSTGRESNV